MPQQDGQNITSPKDGHLAKFGHLANSPDTEERISKMTTLMVAILLILLRRRVQMQTLHKLARWPMTTLILRL